MESEKKPKRPRIGVAPTAGNAESGDSENRYEKVNYPNDDNASGERQPANRQYGDRQGYQQRQYGYQQRPMGYGRNNYNNHYDRPAYQQNYQQRPAASDGEGEKTEGASETLSLIHI